MLIHSFLPVMMRPSWLAFIACFCFHLFHFFTVLFNVMMMCLFVCVFFFVPTEKIRDPKWSSAARCAEREAPNSFCVVVVVVVGGGGAAAAADVV
jgi:hypothetical protein